MVTHAQGVAGGVGGPGVVGTTGGGSGGRVGTGSGAGAIEGFSSLPLFLSRFFLPPPLPAGAGACPSVGASPSTQAGGGKLSVGIPASTPRMIAAQVLAG